MDDKSKKKLIKRGDVILIGAILILAVAVLAALRIFRKYGTHITVRINGEPIARYSLAENGTYDLNGGTNTLVIEGGKAYISRADCPDKICVRHFPVNRSGQVITCLPNRLTVTVD